MKGWFFVVLKVGVAVALIAALISAGKLNLDAIHIRPGGGLWASLSLALILLGLLTIIARWHLLLIGLGIPLRFNKALKLQMVGCLFYNFGLGNAGGDVAQVVVTQKYARGHSVEVALSVLANRLVGMFALLPVAVIGLILNTSMFTALDFVDPMTLVLVAAVLSAFAVSGGYVILTKYSTLTPASSLYHPTIAGAVKNVADALTLLRSQGRYLLAAFCVALVTHLFNVLSFYCMCRAMPMEPLTIGALLFIVPIGYLAAILPIAPAGIGVGQVAFGFLTSLVTTSQPDQGANLFTAYQVTMCAVNLSGLYFFLRLRRQERDDLGVDSNIASKPRIS